jgi:hypothetical protein
MCGILVRTQRHETDTGWSTEGSWEAGVDGGCAGILMWAHPPAHMGEIYYQEFEHGTAEDQAKVIDINSTVTVAYGTFKHCVHTAGIFEIGTRRY